MVERCWKWIKNARNGIGRRFEPCSEDTAKRITQQHKRDLWHIEEIFKYEREGDLTNNRKCRMAHIVGLRPRVQRTSARGRYRSSWKGIQSRRRQTYFVLHICRWRHDIGCGEAFLYFHRQAKPHFTLAVRVWNGEPWFWVPMIPRRPQRAQGGARPPTAQVSAMLIFWTCVCLLPCRLKLTAGDFFDNI